ncbi:MAG: hypothetical protein AB8H79_18575 [Myxococcota bacterium]
MGKTYRVVGALGPGASSPLLAMCVSDGGDTGERVVLGRSLPRPAQAVASGLGSALVVPQPVVLVGDHGTWGVTPYIPGLDLVAVRDRFPEGVPVEIAKAILRDVAWVSSALGEAGAFHGDLSAGSVRIGVDGVVRVLGVRGGDEALDCRAIGELAEGLCTGDGDVNPEVECFLAEWPAATPQLLERLAGSEVDLRAALGDALVDASSSVHEHSLTGQVLGEAAPRGGMPDKVRLAVVGAIMLVFGWVAAWSMIPLR